ncbi:MAG: deoxyribose-phosphate aldolase [Alphaproteobacteria bacterium]|nr:deoxyribose-phosphate aldolase [Alphaproteobacteria bacterium]
MPHPLAQYIDHTILKPATLVKDVQQLCDEAKLFEFCAVCIPPNFVKLAKNFLGDSSVKVATVIGFPFGYSAIEAKVAETCLALVDGADELDMVINISALKNKDYQYLVDEITPIVNMVHNKQKCLKVIIESGILTEDEIIKCCEIYSLAGIDFLKTSTGYAEKGATLDAVKLFKKNLHKSIKIKASGGIKTKAFAEELIAVGADRLGCSSSVLICSN